VIVVVIDAMITAVIVWRERTTAAKLALLCRDSRHDLIITVGHRFD
jgi:hypothetical protein